MIPKTLTKLGRGMPFSKKDSHVIKEHSRNYLDFTLLLLAPQHIFVTILRFSQMGPHTMLL